MCLGNATLTGRAKWGCTQSLISLGIDGRPLRAAGQGQGGQERPLCTCACLTRVLPGGAFPSGALWELGIWCPVLQAGGTVWATVADSQDPGPHLYCSNI